MYAYICACVNTIEILLLITYIFICINTPRANSSFLFEYISIMQEMCVLIKFISNLLDYIKQQRKNIILQKNV